MIALVCKQLGMNTFSWCQMFSISATKAAINSNLEVFLTLLFQAKGQILLTCTTLNRRLAKQIPQKEAEFRQKSSAPLCNFKSSVQIPKALKRLPSNSNCAPSPLWWWRWCHQSGLWLVPCRKWKTHLTAKPTQTCYSTFPSNLTRQHHLLVARCWRLTALWTPQELNDASTPSKTLHWVTAPETVAH